MRTPSFATVMACFGASPAATRPPSTCPVHAPPSQQVATNYLDALFTKNYDRALDFWIPNGTWWTLGTKQFVPWAGFQTIEEHLEIQKQIMEPYNDIKYYPWNWVVSDSGDRMGIEIFLDWRGPTTQYQTNSTLFLGFDDQYRIEYVHEYLDLTQKPQNITAT